MISAEARGAWKEIESRLRPYLARRVASSADVDDLLQEIFVRLHERAAGLQDGERFGGWVYRVAHNAVIDSARKKARRPLVALTSELEPPCDDPSADDEELRGELTSCVAAFVGQLPEPYRSAVTLTELEGLAQKDAAEMLGLSLSGLKSRVQRGRERLRRMFEECCEISVDARGRARECEPRERASEPCGCADDLVELRPRTARS